MKLIAFKAASKSNLMLVFLCDYLRFFQQKTISHLHLNATICNIDAAT